MNFDWVTVILPVINAAGVPLLAIGLILLLRAYQKSVEAYKDTSSHLRDENERLRKRLSEIESSYFGDVERIRDIVSKSITTIEELRSKRTALTSTPDDTPTEAVLSAARKIDKAIQLLKELSTAFKVLDLHLQEHVLYTQREFNNLASKMAISLEEIASDIDYEPVKGTILRAVTAIEIFDASSTPVALEVSRIEDRFLLEKKISLLEKIIEANVLEQVHLEEASKQLLTDVIETLKSESAGLDLATLPAEDIEDE